MHSLTSTFLFVFIYFSLFISFGVCIFVCSGKSNFKQKTSTRVNQRKIKSSSQEYVRRTWVIFWLKKKFSENYVPIITGCGFFTKLSRINVVGNFLSSSTHKICPTFLYKTSILRFISKSRSSVFSDILQLIEFLKLRRLLVTVKIQKIFNSIDYHNKIFRFGET